MGGPARRERPIDTLRPTQAELKDRIVPGRSADAGSFGGNY
jgi:hypothetical protein